MWFHLCIVLMTIVNVSADYDYMVDTMMNCSTEFPKLPEGQEWEVSDSYKECAPKHRGDYFCTKICQLRTACLIFCLGDQYNMECTFQTGMIYIDFSHRLNLDVAYGRKESVEWGAIDDKFVKIINNVGERMITCLPKPLNLGAGAENVFEDCSKLNPAQRKQIEEYLDCYEKSWAPC